MIDGSEKTRRGADHAFAHIDACPKAPAPWRWGVVMSTHLFGKGVESSPTHHIFVTAGRALLTRTFA
jgi:hypothetical protein